MEGFEVSWVKTIEEAKQQSLDEISLIILDWMLPDGQGIDLLKHIRKVNKHPFQLFEVGWGEFDIKIPGIVRKKIAEKTQILINYEFCL